MLSGKRQHWVGLSKKSRKKLEQFPFKDFAILVLIAIIVTMAWTWYGSEVPMRFDSEEDRLLWQETVRMHALRTDRPDLRDENEEALQRKAGLELREELLNRTGAPKSSSSDDSSADRQQSLKIYRGSKQ